MQPEALTHRAGRRERAGGVAILLLCVAAFHGPSLRAGFVYDDAWTIVDNPFLAEPASLGKLLGQGPARQGVPDAGRPTLLATEILDRTLWGKDPRGFHLQNLIWHAGVAILFFIGAMALTGMFFPAFAAAALFAVHPVNVEAVAAVNYREDLLAAFFTLAALLAIGAARRARKGRAGLRALAFLLAAIGVFAKESAMIAAVLLVMVDVSVSSSTGPRRAHRLDALALAAAALIGFAWRAWVMGAPAVVSLTAEIPEAHRRILTAVPRASWSFLQGVAQLIVPVGLSPEYSDPGVAVSAPLGWASLVGIVAALLVSYRHRRAHPYAAVAAFGAVAAYLPTMGFFPLTNLRADRYLYLPSLPLFLGFGVALAAGLPRLRWMRGPATFPLFLGLPRPWLVIAVLTTAFGLKTLRQGRIWRDDLTLWTHAVAAEPDAARAWTHLAEARLRRGMTMAALEAAARSLSLADDGHARGLLGIILMQQGDFARARRELEDALLRTEEHHRHVALNNLGACELELGLVDQALARFREAARLAPGYERARLNAARAHERKGNRTAALEVLRDLTARSPGSVEAAREIERLSRK